MRIFATTLVLIATHLIVTWPARAQEVMMASPQAAVAASGPKFITRGKPLTQEEWAAMQQSLAAGNRISNDAGGRTDRDKLVLSVIGGVILGTAAVVAGVVIGAR